MVSAWGASGEVARTALDDDAVASDSRPGLAPSTAWGFPSTRRGTPPPGAEVVASRMMLLLLPLLLPPRCLEDAGLHLPGGGAHPPLVLDVPIRIGCSGWT